VFTEIAREITSYRSLPQVWYQIQWKFRDEPRPKSGLLRVREFAMKDSYSFDLDDAGLDHSFEIHRDAYARIFERLSLDAIAVQASSGMMGGTGSVEFMVASPAGEDDIARCSNCGYAANVERATATLAPVDDGGSSGELTRFPTPGVRTIAALETVDSERAQGRYYFAYGSHNPDLPEGVPAYLWHQWPDPIVTVVQYFEQDQSALDAAVIYPPVYQTHGTNYIELGASP